MNAEREPTSNSPRARGFVWPPRAMIDLSVHRDRPAPPPLAGAPPARRDTAGAPRTRNRAHAHADITRWPAVLAAIEDAWLDTSRPALWRRLINTTDAQRALGPGVICPGCGRERTTSNPAACTFCRRARPVWSQFVRVGPYRGVLRDAIRELKFHRSRAAGAELGRLLGTQLAARILQFDRNRELRRVILTPIPTTRLRRVTRGIDHALVIARSATRQVRAILADAGHPAEVEMGNLLSRRARKSQTQVAASARHRNVAGAFLPRALGWKRPRDQHHAVQTAAAQPLTRRILRFAGWLLREVRRSVSPWARVLDQRGQPRPGTLIIGVDDISTTGATMHQAIRVLQRSIGARFLQEKRVRLWAAAVAVTGSQDSDK